MSVYGQCINMFVNIFLFFVMIVRFCYHLVGIILRLGHAVRAMMLDLKRKCKADIAENFIEL